MARRASDSAASGAGSPTQAIGSGKTRVCVICLARAVVSPACARASGAPMARKINTAMKQPAGLLQEQTEATEGRMQTAREHPAQPEKDFVARIIRGGWSCWPAG